MVQGLPVAEMSKTDKAIARREYYRIMQEIIQAKATNPDKFVDSDYVWETKFENRVQAEMFEWMITEWSLNLLCGEDVDQRLPMHVRVYKGSGFDL